jgi:O-antigen/teichoic acid export membrane protein
MLVLVLSLISSIVIARTLGTSGRGLFAVAVVFAAVATQFLNLGLHASNTWAVSRDPSTIGVLLANSLLVSVALGGLAILVLGGIGLIQPELLPVSGPMLVLALLSIPISLGYLLLQNLLLGIGRVRIYNVLEGGGRALGVALLLVLAFAGGLDPVMAFATTIVAVGFGFTGALVVVTRSAVNAKARIRTSVTLLLEHGRYGLKAYTAALVSFLVLRLDLLLVQSMKGDATAGLYAVAVSLAEVVYVVPVVTGQLLFPRLARIGSGEARAFMTRTAMAVAALLLPVCVVAALLAEPVLTVVFGQEFAPAAPALVALLPGVFFLSLYTIMANYLAAIGMPAIAVFAPLVALTVNVVLNLALIPSYGATGAALASSAAYLILLAVGVGYIARSRRSET